VARLDAKQHTGVAPMGLYMTRLFHAARAIFGKGEVLGRRLLQDNHRNVDELITSCEAFHSLHTSCLNQSVIMWRRQFSPGLRDRTETQTRCHEDE